MAGLFGGGADVFGGFDCAGVSAVVGGVFRDDFVGATTSDRFVLVVGRDVGWVGVGFVDWVTGEFFGFGFGFGAVWVVGHGVASDFFSGSDELFEVFFDGFVVGLFGGRVSAG